jgi:hypothetical protein
MVQFYYSAKSVYFESHSFYICASRSAKELSILLFVHDFLLPEKLIFFPSSNMTLGKNII